MTEKKLTNKKQTPVIILSVSSHSYLSIAKTFGSIKYNNVKYVYYKENDCLIRFDYQREYEKMKSKPFDDFKKFVKEKTSEYDVVKV
jgi:transposase